MRTQRQKTLTHLLLSPKFRTNIRAFVFKTVNLTYCFNTRCPKVLKARTNLHFNSIRNARYRDLVYCMITTIATSLRHCDIVFNLRLSKNSLQLRCRAIYFFNIINDKTTAANIVKDPEFESTVFPLELPKNRFHPFESIRDNSTFKLMGATAQCFETASCRLQMLDSPRMSDSESFLIKPLTCLQTLACL